MSDIITQSSLVNFKSGSPYNGIILIKNYSVALTKNNKEYIQGELLSGVSIPFKAWGNSKAFTELKLKDYTNVPVYIISTGDSYGGLNSLVLDSVTAVEGYTADQFIPVKYNIDAYWSALKNVIDQKVSEKCKNFLYKSFFDNEDIANRFKVEFAASGHHDNCKGGLLVHTYKVVSLLERVLSFYPMVTKRDNGDGNLVTDTDSVDLFYTAALFHDLGKIWEMNFGVYQPSVSVVTHRYIIVEHMINQGYMQEIIELYGQEWWYNFVSAMLQHHGEFADPPKSLVALVLHKVDNFDSDLTLISQCMEKSVTDNCGTKFKYDNKYYVV